MFRVCTNFFPMRFVSAHRAVKICYTFKYNVADYIIKYLKKKLFFQSLPVMTITFLGTDLKSSTGIITLLYSFKVNKFKLNLRFLNVLNCYNLNHWGFRWWSCWEGWGSKNIIGNWVEFGRQVNRSLDQVSCLNGLKRTNNNSYLLKWVQQLTELDLEIWKQFSRTTNKAIGKISNSRRFHNDSIWLWT